MQLSERLTAVAGLAKRCSCLADIGTDHGYVPIYLIEKGIIRTAIAMDVNKGPLQRADRNIKAHNLSKKVETRLSDGLHALSEGEVQGIVVAGMGGPLTIRILEEGKNVAASLDYMVLQPQSEIHLVRTYLYEQGYQIVDEDMVFEDGKYYPMMLVQPQTNDLQLPVEKQNDHLQLPVEKQNDHLQLPAEKQNDKQQMPVEEQINKQQQSIEKQNNGQQSSVEKLHDDQQTLSYSLTEEEAYFGPILIRKKHPVLKQFLDKEEAAVEKIMTALKQNPTEKGLERLEELKADFERIERTKEMIG